ncbi:HK97 family phage prohead protease [Mycolicibacterium arseniciresistens]|uniref:HK97 family phage prohead protease n=1 Tax=Mycolicibacterium arseniciresistens TaxID=3062257 RepID=A0ABT8UDZ0_9MYCO|nr:HK97 family phage prohead protease [Mycolicibacterium arseniciresistens]MDO3636006.1 HK97 family phage prohead protease [Mycolicibacterium arseniciresistens]
MHRKTVPIAGIKTAGLDDGEFEGWASTFGNADHHNDRVMPGAFAKSIASGQTVPLLWMHKSDDPRAFVGDVVEAVETPEGLKIRGRFDLDTEFGAAAYKQVRARRIGSLSIGYAIRHATKGADGVNELTDLDLVEVSIVARGANDRALITAAKSAGRPTAPIRSALAKDAATRYLKEHDMTTNARIETLTKDRESQLELIKQILDTADELQRDLTADETERVDAATKEAKSLDESIAAAKSDAALVAQAKSLVADIGGLPGTQAGSVESSEGKRLSFKGMGAAVATKMLGENGTKALAPSGATVVGQEFEADPIALGRVATGLLDVLPVKQHSSPEYAFMRQGTRTNNAAVVAEGAVKPTSPLGVTRVEQSLAVVAHLSEGVPRYWLIDSESLQDFVNNELQYGLGLAVEAKVIADINAASGIQTQAFSTSALQTIRKSLTKLEVAGLEPGAIVLNPVDFEGLELSLASTNAIEHMSLPYDAATRRLFGVPIATTISEAAGTSHVLAKDAVVLDTDTQGVGVQWSENSNAEDFSRNLIRARSEGRFGTSVRSLLGVVVADLTA